MTLEQELRVIEQLKGRLLHCVELECQGLDQLDRCNTSVAFFKSDAPSLPPGVPLHQPHSETRTEFLALLRDGERSRRQLLRHLSSVQTHENLRKARKRQGIEFPRAGTVKAALGRIEPRTSVRVWECNHLNVLTLTKGPEGERIRGFLRSRLQQGDNRGAPPQLGRAWLQGGDARQALSEVLGTNDGVLLEQTTAVHRVLVLREPELLGQTLEWMDSQPDTCALRSAVRSIDAWTDRVVTPTATKAAMEHHLGMNAQSSRLVCVDCNEKVTVVAMGDAGAGRKRAHACVKCRRLVKTTLLTPPPTPFPRSCLEEHPNRCEGPD